MANILILGGGFGGVIAAETLARQIPKEHQITLVSRSPKFIFYPELVRLAFGKCEPDDISFDLREAMLYHHKGLWDDEPAIVRQGRFWSWAKQVHDKYWLTTHS